MKTFDVKLNSKTLITPTVMHLSFSQTNGEVLKFLPGQFVTFLFDNDDKPIKRSYSLSTIPGQSTDIEIAVSPVTDGLATKIFEQLQPGNELTCSGPFGRLILKEQDEPRKLILVATGTGVSPYRAMLPQLTKRLTNDNELQVTLLLGVQYRHDLLYADDFVNFAQANDRFEFRAYLSRESELQQNYEYQGYVQTAFPELGLDPETDMVFLCGNPNMIDEAFAQLQEAGFPTRQVKREKYISAK